MLNTDKANIKFISKPFNTADNKTCKAIQKSKSDKVIPAISAMKKSADYLID